MNIYILEDHTSEIADDATAILLHLTGIQDGEDIRERAHTCYVLTEHLLNHTKAIQELIQRDIEKKAMSNRT